MIRAAAHGTAPWTAGPPCLDTAPPLKAGMGSTFWAPLTLGSLNIRLPVLWPAALVFLWVGRLYLSTINR